MFSCRRIVISVILVFILLTKEGTSQLTERFNLQSSCASKTNCGECTRTKDCAWCMQSYFGDRPRCFHPSSTSLTESCLEEWTWNPDNELTIIRNLELNQSRSTSETPSTSGSGSRSSSRRRLSSGSSSTFRQSSNVRMSPQRVSLKLRINESHRLNVSYLEGGPSPRVELKNNATSIVHVKYFSSCLGNGPLIETNKCDGLKVGDVVNFTVEIVVTSCRRNKQDWNQIFQIYPVGIADSLIIDLDMLCACPCESPSHPIFEYASPKCHGSGSYKCGICECDDYYFGAHCECSLTDIHSLVSESNQCRPDNSSAIDCSGRGNCICGFCECERRHNVDEVISGQFCECDNFSCARHNGLLCSGQDHGVCSCGVCNCNSGWTGEACDCPTTTEMCKSPSSGEICSGHGICECGVCRCDVTPDERFLGRYCEKHATCTCSVDQ